jgi:glycosidase
MAKDTPASYRSLVIYEIYVRNHGPHGNFGDVEADLPRIRSMGVDVAWFMPIHPIGKINRKGSQGSPYSIADYREINPEYGTKADFKRLIDTAHRLGLKVMIDVVYNHTAHDSTLVKQHPDWFHQDDEGHPVTTVPDWADVIDLRYPNAELSAYLIDCLKNWAEFGVDGFRCDVASIVPVDFWMAARGAVAQVKPGVIWLAESVHADFIAGRRRNGLLAQSDCEVFQAFDLEYDYEIWPIWQAAVVDPAKLARYTDLVKFQEVIYPANYVKMRCVENHDNARIMRLAPSQSQALAWTAFQAFNKGAFLIYGGQESGATHTPSLFEFDKVDWGSYAWQPFLTRLAKLKKDPAMIGGNFYLLENKPTLQAAWMTEAGGLYGIFNTAKIGGEAAVQLPDGTYTNLLDDLPVMVKHGRMAIPQSAAVVRCAPNKHLSALQSDFYEFRLAPE